MEKPEVGSLVRVRSATGEQKAVRVACLGEGVVYVTTEEEYSRARAEAREPEPFIGYPPEDVIGFAS